MYFCCQNHAPVEAPTLDFAGRANTFVGSEHCGQPPTFHRKITQNASKIKPKMHQKSYQIRINFSLIFSSIFSSKINPKCLQKGREKFKKIRFWAAGGALGSPRRPRGHQFGQNIAQRAPKAPKMLPRRHPKVEKWRPRHPQSSQNAAQKTARTAKMEP